MIQRILEKSLTNTPKSILLLGARQVGKSTLINSLKPDLTINFAKQSTYLEYAKDVSLIERNILAFEKNSKKENITIAIDEIQRLPLLLNTIQALIDEKPKQRKFYLTGSSARKLKRGKANLLPGRILYKKLLPLTYWEIKNIFSIDMLDKMLLIGSLPEVINESYGVDVLESYVETYLREEIQAEALTKDLGAYGRFLDLAAELSGQYINYSKIASDSEINKETIRRYVGILEDTLIINRINSFKNIHKKRKVRSKDRFVFFDLGVRNAVLKKHRTSITQNEKGHLFEQWLILQVQAYINYFSKPWQLSSFRDEYGNEVDLIIEAPDAIYAIEIKYGTKYKTSYTKGLKTFKTLLGKPIKSVIVYTGSTKQLGDIKEDVLPLSSFLDEFLPGI